MRRVDIEAGAEAEIIGIVGIARHVGPARAGVRRDEDQAELGAGFAEFALLGDVGMGAGEAGEIPDHGKLCAGGMWGNIDREHHVGSGRLAGMAVHALHAAIGSVGRDSLDRHAVMLRGI
ncbi:hypothetical protein ABIF74_006419 [Bradyrhizobium japonicum]